MKSKVTHESEKEILLSFEQLGVAKFNFNFKINTFYWQEVEHFDEVFDSLRDNLHIRCDFGFDKWCSEVNDGY